MTSTGVSKVLLKLRQNIQDGNSYEAFQMYHSISQRHLKKKEFNLAIELLNDGAKTMIQCGQHGSAIDLSHRLLDIYDLELKLCDIAREKIMDLFELFFETPKFCEQYTQQVLKWSLKYTSDKGGCCQLQHVFGARYHKGLVD
jgi:hypothetical protein